MAYNTYSRRTGQANMSFSKLATQCFIRTLIAAVIGIIIYMSVVFVVNAINYKVIGYEILYSADGENFDSDAKYTYYYTGKEGEDWEDENLEQFKDENGNYKEGYYRQDIPSKLGKSTMNTLAWIAQIPTLIIWGALIYTLTWNVGSGAANKKEFGGVEFDKLRGLKAGLVAVIPYAVTYLILVVARLSGAFSWTVNWAVSLFKILNYNCFAFNDMIISGGILSISILELICLVFVLVPLPLFAAFGYAMGLRHTNIKEKIVYKKEESGE